MKIIELTRGLVALVDDLDFESLNRHKWCALAGHNTFYAVRVSKKRMIYMHREIWPSLKKIDHKNGFGLDNRRRNLRPASSSQNGANHRKQKNNTSGHMGVTKDMRRGNWRAQIKVGGRMKHVGCFDTAREAGKAYNAAAQKFFGEFARLNSI